MRDLIWGMKHSKTDFMVMVAQLGNFTKIQMHDFMKCKLYLNRVVKNFQLTRRGK